MAKKKQMAKKFSGEYKQGYLNGYARAFEDLASLFKREDYDFERAKSTCRAFWVNELSDWLANEDGDMPALYIPEDKETPVTATVNPDAEPEDPYHDKNP
jgi:hypothetical protein